jgi:nucleoside-diphosphate-sugar epimerase
LVPPNQRNPITEQEAHENPATGYRASKTFAEKAAWDFLEKEKPNFTIATVNPPLVFGPIVSLFVIVARLITYNWKDTRNRQS